MGKHEQLHQRLLDSHNAILEVIDLLSEAQAVDANANPGWTVRDLVAHLAAAEIGHCRVIRRLLAGQSTAIPGFDLDAHNNAEVDARQQRTFAELLAEYKANRAATLALLDTVGDEDWDRGGPHPGGFETTVEGTFRVISIHEKRHLREIKAAL